VVHQEVGHLQEASVAVEVVVLQIKTMLLALLLTREAAKSLPGVRAEEARGAIEVEVALVEVGTTREEDKRKLVQKISLICFLVVRLLRNKMLLRFLELQIAHL
jgi:hypothetical protein